MLTILDHEVRGLLARCIAELGHAPKNGELARRLGVSEQEIEQSLLRMHDAHGLLLQPDSRTPWVVHPFALSSGSCWVQTAQRGYWANCLYCAFGICAAMEQDATITTRLGGEGQSVQYIVTNGRPSHQSHVFHLSTPAARWWDNVIFACASFQSFANESEVDPWCARHDLPRGWVFTLPDLWSFARDWYGEHLRPGWRKRSKEEVLAVFERHRLTGPFWSID